MKDEESPLPLGARLGLLAGKLVLQLLARSWRIRRVNTEVVTRMRSSGKGFIFALWHGELLPLLWNHRDEGAVILISEHRDGEIVAQAAKSLGYGLIRGSTTRGAGRALIAMVRGLEAGHEIAITPDGPKGPRRKFAPGALVAAQRTDAYIIPVGVVADRVWRLRSWDQFIIPKPFARLSLAYGEPAKVHATSARAAAGETERFEKLMDDAEQLARG